MLWSREIMNTQFTCTVNTLDENLLRTCANLERLNLERRKLYRIEANAFDNFPDIVSINLASNSLNTIPENCFRNSAKVISLVLNMNSISIIPIDAINKLRELKELSIAYNLITMLHKPFTDFNKLVVLNLSHNLIEKIERHTFAFLVNLKILDLGYNRLATIDQSAFLFLRNLELLYLNNNYLRTLHHVMFMFMPHLTNLCLQNNKLIGLPAEIFSLSHELTLLNLDNNSIPKYENSLFDGCTSIKHLVVHLTDEISFMDFSVLNKLQIISIHFDSEKRLSFFDHIIPFSLPYQIGLIEFKLIVNYMKIEKYNLFQLPDTLQNLHIECLNPDYSETGRYKFMKQMRVTPRLKRLTLIGLNGLHIVQWNVCLRPSSHKILSLEYLDFRRSILKSGVSIIQPQFLQLKHLDLSHCDFYLNLKHAFKYLFHLEFLSLEGLKVLTVRQLLFAQNKKLTHLILEDCSIAKIQKNAFVMLKKLVYLNLRRNPALIRMSNSFIGLSASRTYILF